MSDEASNNVKTELATAAVPASTNAAVSSMPENFLSFVNHISRRQVHDETLRYLLVPVGYATYQGRSLDELYHLVIMYNTAAPCASVQLPSQPGPDEKNGLVRWTKLEKRPLMRSNTGLFLRVML